MDTLPISLLFVRNACFTARDDSDAAADGRKIALVVGRVAKDRHSLVSQSWQ